MIKDALGHEWIIHVSTDGNDGIDGDNLYMCKCCSLYRDIRLGFGTDSNPSLLATHVTADYYRSTKGKFRWISSLISPINSCHEEKLLNLLE